MFFKHLGELNIYYVLCFMYYVLRITYYVLCITYYVLCIIYYTLYIIHYFVLYAVPYNFQNDITSQSYHITVISHHSHIISQSQSYHSHIHTKRHHLDFNKLIVFFS